MNNLIVYQAYTSLLTPSHTQTFVCVAHSSSGLRQEGKSQVDGICLGSADEVLLLQCNWAAHFCPY
jgi:hypothetical protein